MKTNDNDYKHIPYYDALPSSPKRDNNCIAISRINTPFGDVLAGATTAGICLLEFTDTQRIEMQLTRLKKSQHKQVISIYSEYFSPLAQQLNAYFKGNLDAFSLPLDICGTAFQQQVWDALQTIPYGETRSYQQQALAIDNPKAVRAVANANRNNKISIIIPCHRVIGKDGSMTGYGGGIWRKASLLDLEANTRLC
jgi:AraC family transcriptional regulator of adaptative response/methylated-DNA-[protein]-cysteine methyltransferase